MHAILNAYFDVVDDCQKDRTGLLVEKLQAGDVCLRELKGNPNTSKDPGKIR